MLERMSKKLSVRLHGIQMGILEQNLSGKLSFCYDSSAKQALSFSLPLREQAYDEKHCEAYFGGLLPESEIAKKIIAKKYGISANNIFSLLQAIGHDCAGAVSFHSTEEPQVDQLETPLRGQIVSEEELYNHIRNLPIKPLFMGFDGLRLSLAGVQDKAAVCLIDKQIALPTKDCPTTHILKPATSGYEGIVENEYICLKTAEQVGLSIPHIEIRRVKEISFLLIQRYDRQIQNQLIKRIHQEDFCQALGISTRDKYQNEGGPGLHDCFQLLNKVVQPALDRTRLASGMVFNFLIGNMDAHGKNFSLLHPSPIRSSLAPFYDLLCTLVYPELSTKMAMKIGSHYKAKDVKALDWEALCLKIGYSYPAIKKLILSQSEKILKALETNRQFYKETLNKGVFVDKLLRVIHGNILGILNRLKL